MDKIKEIKINNNSFKSYFVRALELYKENIEICKNKDESNGYKNFLQKLLENYRNYYIHEEHEDEKIELKEYDLKYIENLEKIYNSKVKSTYNNQYKDIDKVILFDDFLCYNGDKTKSFLSRDAQLFLLALFLPRHIFNRLLSETSGYKRTDKDKNDPSPFYEKRNTLLKLSKKVKIHYEQKEYDKNIHIFLKLLSVIDQVPEIKDEKLHPKKKDDKEINYTKNINFSAYAIEFIKDFDLLKDVKFFKAGKKDKKKAPILTDNDYNEKIYSIYDNGEKTEIPFDELPHYIDNGNAFCNFKSDNENINFKLSEYHLKMIITSYFYKNYLFKDNLLFNKIKEKIEKQRKTNRSKKNDLDLEKRVNGVLKKFESFYENHESVKDYKYITEIIKLIYFINEKGLKDKEIRSKKDPKNKGIKEKSIYDYQKIFLSIQSNFRKETFIDTLKDLNLYNKETNDLCGLIKNDYHQSLLEACKNFISKNKDIMKKLYIKKENKSKKTPESFFNSHNFSLSNKDLNDVFTFKKLTECLTENWLDDIPYDTSAIKESFKDKSKDQKEVKNKTLNFATSNYLMQKMAYKYLERIASSKSDANKKKIKIINPEKVKKLTGIILNIQIYASQGSPYKFNLHASEFNKYRHIIMDFEKHLNLLQYKDKRSEDRSYDKDDLNKIDNDVNDCFYRWAENLIELEIKMLKPLSDTDKESLIKLDKEGKPLGYIDFTRLVKKDNVIIKQEDKYNLINIRNMVFHNDIKNLKRNDINSLFKKYGFQEKNDKKVKKIDKKR